MSGVICPQEAAVSKAARTGEWQESLAAHAAGCAFCWEIVHSSRWMQVLAESSEKSLVLPDAKLVWWRAQLANRQAKAEKSQTMLEWLETFSGAVVPLGLAGWVAWNWYGIQWQATQLLAGWLPRLWPAAFSLASLAPALLFMAAIFLAYPLFVRE